jgi:anti-sigma factor RsiW
MRLSIFNRHPHAQLSAYLDGELIPLRIEAMQAHLASCQSCRTELEALRELKTGLAALPEIAAPRSFALSPEMADRPLREKERPAVPVRATGLTNGMRLAGAGMTLALVLVLVLDFTGSGTKGGGAPTAANVQQFAAAQNSDSSSSEGGIASAPTPVPAAGDVSAGPAAFPTANPTPAQGGISSEPGPSAGIPAGPALAPAPVGGPSPAIGQPDGSPSIDKSLPGTAEGSATNAPAALNVQPSVFDAQQPAAASTGSGGGVDVLLIVALVLAAGLVLTVAASFVLPRLGREDV